MTVDPIKVITASGVEVRDIRIYRAGEWSAVYINGSLANGPHDHYICEDYILSLIGAEVYESDVFLLGTSQQAATTVEDIEEYEEAQSKRLWEATKLKQQIAQLSERVRELDPEDRLS